MFRRRSIPYIDAVAFEEIGLSGVCDAAIDSRKAMCDIQSRSETLSIRIPSEDKRALFEIAARQGGSVNEFVRQAIRGKMKEVTSRPSSSPLSVFFGSVPVDVSAPTNDAVRRAMKK